MFLCHATTSDPLFATLVITDKRRGDVTCDVRAAQTVTSNDMASVEEAATVSENEDEGHEVEANERGECSVPQGGSAPPHDQDDGANDDHSNGDAEVLIEAGRKIGRKDVQRVFEKSTTTGVSVSREQIARIRAIHHKISEGVRFNFNYCCLLMIASVVAGLGLAIDSSSTVVSSMLLSPIMGPVIGMSYGVIIMDVPLIKRSALVECVSILLCLVFGAIIGLCTMNMEIAESWPTSEMMSRGTRETFLCGIPIAFFSGLGVAMSVLDDQTGSLVGVAISASLLPPAVNCGLLLVVAAVKKNDFEAFR